MHPVALFLRPWFSQCYIFCIFNKFHVYQSETRICAVEHDRGTNGLGVLITIPVPVPLTTHTCNLYGFGLPVLFSTWNHVAIWLTTHKGFLQGSDDLISVDVSRASLTLCNSGGLGFAYQSPVCRAENFDVTRNTVLDSHVFSIHFKQIEEGILAKLNQGSMVVIIYDYARWMLLSSAICHLCPFLLELAVPNTQLRWWAAKLAFVLHPTIYDPSRRSHKHWWALHRVGSRLLQGALYVPRNQSCKAKCKKLIIWLLVGHW